MSEQAFFWLDKAAENGSFAARYVRGGMYCEGLGCKKDIEKAEKDLQYVYSNCKMAKLASDAGVSLALLYKLEYNSPDYLRKAEVILKELAERGHPEAQYEYSCILCNKGDSNFIYWLDHRQHMMKTAPAHPRMMYHISVVFRFRGQSLEIPASY